MTWSCGLFFLVFDILDISVPFAAQEAKMVGMLNVVIDVVHRGAGM
jgi:hypothetical protein